MINISPRVPGLVCSKRLFDGASVTASVVGLTTTKDIAPNYLTDIGARQPLRAAAERQTQLSVPVRAGEAELQQRRVQLRGGCVGGDLWRGGSSF